jgi:hypothetical protein
MRSSAGFPQCWPGSGRGQAAYADIDGLKMFYEIRGVSDPIKVPVVLLHGAVSATGTSLEPLPDLLAQTRAVIGFGEGTMLCAERCGDFRRAAAGAPDHRTSGQRSSSTMRGATPKSVSATPQSMKPTAR